MLATAARDHHPSAQTRSAPIDHARASCLAPAGKAESSQSNGDHAPKPSATRFAAIRCFTGTIEVDSKTKIGVYEQEVGRELFELSLGQAIESIYLSRDLSITDTKVRQLLGDYLFTPGDKDVPVAQLSGGQKARLQLIAMMADAPNLLILDEPTNHLDLPSIEELETTLKNYRGAILYVSHDTYFQSALGGTTICIEHS